MNTEVELSYCSVPHTDGLTGTYKKKKSGLKMPQSMDISAVLSWRESTMGRMGYVCDYGSVVIALLHTCT